MIANSSILIAKASRPLGGLGDTAARLLILPETRRHPLSSSKHQPTHNIRGQCSERDPIPVRVRNDADLRAGRADQLSLESSALRFFHPLVDVVPVARHPSAFSSPVPVKSVLATRTLAQELLHGLQREFEN